MGAIDQLYSARATSPQMGLEALMAQDARSAAASRLSRAQTPEEGRGYGTASNYLGNILGYKLEQLMGLPGQMMESSARLQHGYGYDPGPVLEGAQLMMGANAGAPRGALGTGPSGMERVVFNRGRTGRPLESESMHPSALTSETQIGNISGAGQLFTVYDMNGKARALAGSRAEAEALRDAMRREAWPVHGEPYLAEPYPGSKEAGIYYGATSSAANPDQMATVLGILRSRRGKDMGQ